jgi:hypothetical protein
MDDSYDAQMDKLLQKLADQANSKKQIAKINDEPSETTQYGGKVIYNKRLYKVHMGNRGGKYIMTKGKKVYL